MSDPFHDAYRPANRPKGMGWWPEDRQREYCQSLWNRGDTDEWLIDKMLSFGLISRAEALAAYEKHHPEWVESIRRANPPAPLFDQLAESLI